MAGLVELLLGKDNPVTQWTGRNSNLLTGLGTSLLSDGMNFAPAQAGSVLDRQAAQQKDADAKLAASTNATKQWLAQNYPDLAQAVDAGLPVSDAWQEAFKRQQPGYGQPKAADLPSSIQEYEYAKQNGYQGSFMDWQTVDKGSGSRPALGTTIYTGKDANGNIVPLQAGQGEFVQTKLPDGVAFDPGAMSGAKTDATVDAKAAGAARAALPGAEQAVNVTRQAIAEIRNNPNGMKEWFSQWGPRGVYVNPGSDMGNFVTATTQANGNAFMAARQMLKGGGQITDYEGRRGEDAYSRMQAAIESGDQQAYLRAITDFESAVADGYAKLQAASQGAYSKDALSGPAIGAIENGYRYKGGDPGDPNSWEQVQ